MLLIWLYSIHVMSYLASADSQENNQWFQAGVDLIKANLKVRENRNTAKNAIMFLGDGMGISTVTAARILEGQMRGETGEENWLSFEKFPWTALSKTYNTDQQVADSAGTATAYLNGVKARAGTIGVDETVVRGLCKTMTEKAKVKSIITLAEEAGMSTGFVTTTRVTHASPAVLYAHSPDRDWSSDYYKRRYATKGDNNTACKDIALQLSEYSHGDGIDVIFGGGRRDFMPNNETDPEYPTEKGYRGDGRNLIDEWILRHQDAVYLWNKTDFDALDVTRVKQVMGLFEPSHMQYEVDRKNDTGGEPSIAEMTEKAIRILSRNPKGYFLFVEGGRIDHGHHAAKAVRALTDAIAMAEAVKKATDITNKDDTLILTTADHSHTFTISGYPKRGNPIFGLVVDIYNRTVVASSDKLPYTTLGYANGPGGLKVNATRADLTMVNTADKDFKSQALYYQSSEAHGGEDVGIYADGPGAYLMHGVVEQNYIFHVMDHALCLSDSKQGTCTRHVTRGGAPKTTPRPPRGAASSLVPGLWMMILLSVMARFGN
ncbi:alkaline phosphatase isoform X2 [Nematostella vectensis]|uniref:alkaline phosphatase isoform X2 n=1 Tax=Nematostella vectensis TaxID=45351 RepID=UPI002076FFB0|nr:alkaline phosphatase isoform X2 [Nematostella vectensis]